MSDIVYWQEQAASNKKMLGFDAQNNRVKGIDWKEFVLGAMATTVCYPHQMHQEETKGSKYTLLCL